MVCALDKSEQDVNICCPSFWQEFGRRLDDQDVAKVHLAKEGVDKRECLDDANETISLNGSTLSYTSGVKGKPIASVRYP